MVMFFSLVLTFCANNSSITHKNRIVKRKDKQGSPTLEDDENQNDKHTPQPASQTISMHIRIPSRDTTCRRVATTYAKQ